MEAYHHLMILNQLAVELAEVDYQVTIILRWLEAVEAVVQLF